MNGNAIKRLIPKPTNTGIDQQKLVASQPNKIVTSKYTMPNFLLLNFLHQVSKPATFLFFVTLILMSIPAISPFEPFSYLIAFSIVVGVSMIKDGMEDYQRHVDDKKANETKIEILNCAELEDGKTQFLFSEKDCMDLQPGDFIIIRRNQEVFADVVMLRSKIFHKEELRCCNHCFVQTSSLDGESNLKKKNAVEIPEGFRCCENLPGVSETLDDSSSPCFEHFFKKIKSFDLKDTGDSFEDFECDLNIDDRLVITNEKNVILRGSKLKNTELCLGLVVGVGMDTKVMKSLNKNKRTKTIFDTKMNFIFGNVLILYFFMMIMTMIFGMVFVGSNSNSYLNIGGLGSSFFIVLLSNYILYIYLIPLSLYVMLEIARFVHALFISSDKDMSSEGISSKCHNSNVIEDLGTIDYILSDKTGTITKNSMTLKYVHVGNSPDLEEPNSFFDSLQHTIDRSNVEHCISNILSNGDSKEKNDILMLLNMLICNSVEILNHNPEGVSQEELCFLEAASKSGFNLAERAEHYVIISILGTKIKLDILGTREFISKRQRMDVVVKIFGKTYLLVKGSDQKLLDRNTDKEKLKTINQSNEYRCLVMKYKELTEKEEREFIDATTVNIKSEGNNAPSTRNSIYEKRQNEEGKFNELELTSHYSGSVFIDDELQEDVQNTMRDLKDAGIKIWMVTGDKKETAEACARNSCLIEFDDFLSLSGHEALKMIEESVKMEGAMRKPFFNFLQGGRPLANVPFANSQNTEVYSNTTSPLSITESIVPIESRNVFNKKALVIYRATPSQKGRIAAILSEAGKHTLSIGDGTNDVGMLKGSDVGVGVMGKEGTQAAMAGDFAIPQFKMLKNLLFVHGRYTLQRYSLTALNSYYKNIVFIFAQFIYNLYSGASGRPLYSSLIFNYYNLFFTSMIPFSISLFDKDVDQAAALRTPQSYAYARLYFNQAFVYLNVLFAIFEATMIFYAIQLFTANEIANGSGIVVGYAGVSMLFSTIIVFSVILRQIRSVSFRVVFTDVAIALSIILNAIAIIWIEELYTKSKYVIFYLLASPYFYFIVFSLISIIYLADTMFENLKIHIFEKLKGKH